MVKTRQIYRVVLGSKEHDQMHLIQEGWLGRVGSASDSDWWMPISCEFRVQSKAPVVFFSKKLPIS